MKNNICRDSIFFILILVFACYSHSHNFNIDYIDISGLPEILIRLSVHDGPYFVNTLMQSSFDIEISNRPVPIKSFSKNIEEEQKLYILLIFDESESMKGPPIINSRKIARDLIHFLSIQDEIAYIGLNPAGNRVLDFTQNHNAVIRAFSNIQPSIPFDPDKEIENEINRRLHIFRDQIINSGQKGAVFIFSNTFNLEFNYSYNMTVSSPYIFIFNFNTTEAGIPQISSSNFYFNPGLDLNISKEINDLLKHRKCLYEFTLLSSVHSFQKPERLSIHLKDKPYSTISFMVHPADKTDISFTAGLSDLFLFHRFLMYLSLLSGIHIFLYFMLWLIKDLSQKHILWKFLVKFLWGQIIVIFLSFLISILY